jgi:hypothetical protein
VAKAALTLLIGLLLSLGAAAQQPSGDAGKGKPQRPLWSELSPKQQAVLAPLAADWDSLDTMRRKKWVSIANRYPRMTQDQQQRLQDRMQAWAKLTPAQRRVARENYQSLRQLPRPQRGEVKQKWQQYQQSAAQRPDSAPEDPAATEPAAPNAPDK